MTTRNPRVRFLQNNYAAATATTSAASSAVSGFPLSSGLSTTRHKRYKAAGAFIVTSSNKKIYINDGADKTITLTEATYAGGAALATHIQTQLNASSTNWTVSYSTTTCKFTVGRSSGTALLRLSVTTDASWSMLGYVGAVDDDVGTGQAADERRNHTSEIYTFDMGAAVQCRAFCLIGPAGELFGLSSTAVVTVKANNTASMTSPAQSATATVEDDGVFCFLDEWSDNTYRYWEVEIQDKTSTLGPNFEIGYFYVGDYVTPTTRNINVGFERRLVDPSQTFEADSGALWYRTRTKYWVFDSVTVEHVADTDRTEIERVYSELGTCEPFILSIDPTEAISARVGEMTKMVRFMGEPAYQHNRYKYWDIGMAFREVV